MADDSFYVGSSGQPDKYRLIHQVGSGGEAQVWKAEVKVSEQWEPVAVKILRADRMRDVDKWKARWSDQAEMLRFARHPGVVGVREHFEGPAMHPAGEGDAGPVALYLVMNWVDGSPLREWVPIHRSSADYFESLKYLAQVADVLDWLHSGRAIQSGRPVIHADVTPANVLITPSGQAVLVDFGLTRLAAGISPTVEGTRGYMAPEVLASASYSPASDRYSFGALTFFVLTGQQPPTDPAALAATWQLVPTIAAQPGLIDHLMTMVDPDPSRRPPCAEWIRFFRASGTTSVEMAAPPPGTATGQSGAFAAAAPTETLPIAKRPRKGRKGLVVVALVTVALIGGGIAYAVAGHDKTHLATSAAKTSPSTSRVPTAPTTGSTPTTPAPTTTDEPTTTAIATGTTIPLSPAATPAPPTDAHGNPLSPDFLSAATTVGAGTAPQTGLMSVNGVSYPHSVWTNNDCYACEGKALTFDYNLERAQQVFEATVGLGDTSTSDAKVQFDVFMDGDHVYTGTFGLGQSFALRLSAVGVLRLTLSTTLVSNGVSGDIFAVWGNAALFSTPPSN